MTEPMCQYRVMILLLKQSQSKRMLTEELNFTKVLF